MNTTEPPTTSTDQDRAFCRAMLPRVSRTFALSIQTLPGPLSEAVGVAYLLCRVVDTVEDDPTIRNARGDLFDAFDAALAGGDVERFEQLAASVSLGPTDAERELVSGAGAVFRVYRALSQAQRYAIAPHVAEMSRGMREYAQRADASACGLRLADLPDLERYCYFVAGTVGGLLTSLFLPFVPEGAAWPKGAPREPQREAWLRERAKSFGLGLQLVNIVKDVASDLQRGDCFLPEALAEAHGVELDGVLDAAHRKDGIALLRALCARARAHLDRAAEYALAWPAVEGEAIRLFCSVPLALAYATLREVEDGRDALRTDRAPTVSRGLVQAVFLDASRSVRDDAALASLFERCKLGAIGRCPRPKNPIPSQASPFRGAPPHEPRTNRADMMQDTHPFENERSYSGKVFVTGAAGHLGANLLHRLLTDGRDVRVLLREGDNNEAVGAIEQATGRRVERVMGDLRDYERLERGMDGCETAFHVAAKVSTVSGSPDDLQDLFGCNVIGTANLLRAARRVGVKRAVVSGSFSAVGFDRRDPSKPSDESMPFDPFEEHMPYGYTKAHVEHECLKAVADGLDVVIATSCAVLGPWDYIPSRMGRTLVDFAHGRLRAYIPGGFEFVAAKDIVEGHLLAMRRGRTGQKYIFSTEFVTVDELMDLFEEVSGRPRPRLRLPPPVMAGIAEVSSFVLTKFFPKVPQRFTPGAVRILRMQRHADTTRARTELGFEPTSIRAAIHAAYADFARRGIVPQGPALRGGDARLSGASGASSKGDKAAAKEVAA